MDIRVGNESNLCLSSNKKIYIFGSNKDGCLGFGDKERIISKPTIHLFFNNKNIVYIRYGLLHGLCISIYGDGCYIPDLFLVEFDFVLVFVLQFLSLSALSLLLLLLLYLFNFDYKTN